MLPTSRRIGGITRPRDFRVFPRSTGVYLERLKVDDSLSSDVNTSIVPERILGFSRHVLQDSVEATQWPLDATHVGALLFTHSSFRPSSAHQSRRGFHTSSSVPYDSTSYNVTDVPDFFLKYKQCRATQPGDFQVIGQGHEELGLLSSLTHSILSGDVVVETCRLRAKIPVEYHVAGGYVVHPSGFVVPGPGHTSTSDVARAKERERNENVDRAVQTAAVAHRVLESDLEQVDATTLSPSHKVPFEVHESDGTVKHPSGFVPPTPAHKFRSAVNANVLWDVKKLSPARAVLRTVHTSSTPRDLEDY